MKKKYRLKKNWDFQKIINNNKSLQNKYLVVYYQKSNSFHIGITVPKKFENSVGRNFNKRQLKAIIHQINLYDLNYDFVIIARKEFCNSDFATKKTAIAKLFEKFRDNEKNK
ncbi:ribonuclease P protein component [Mycoplasmopsis mustelae]|uniref:Ribonuclease P protein component n=1 Tax=Mycoplasmopsis mustelae TaxID=171289 RepID=A0A4R7UF12_9BACT|nr:ribonuclease P protein component [Mycoplasmopsis mustelae]TDV24483.1 ribonuclease P protein component [Mycoplasmopsis mustelae]